MWQSSPALDRVEDRANGIPALGGHESSYRFVISPLPPCIRGCFVDCTRRSRWGSLCGSISFCDECGCSSRHAWWSSAGARAEPTWSSCRTPTATLFTNNDGQGTRTTKILIGWVTVPFRPRLRWLQSHGLSPLSVGKSDLHALLVFKQRPQDRQRRNNGPDGFL